MPSKKLHRDRLLELLCLTDTALDHARKNNIPGVSVCLDKRRAILENTRMLSAEVSGKGDMSFARKCIIDLLEKDESLNRILKNISGEMEKEDQKYRQIKSLRKRFVGKKNSAPRLIDKRA